MHSYLIPAGGLCTGAGIMTMLFSWDTKMGGDMATHISKVGYQGLTDWTATSNAPIAFGLIFVGIAMMVFGNATAWKETGGY